MYLTKMLPVIAILGLGACTTLNEDYFLEAFPEATCEASKYCIEATFGEENAECVVVNFDDDECLEFDKKAARECLDYLYGVYEEPDCQVVNDDYVEVVLPDFCESACMVDADF
ncbi:MAG: hypothetical protein HN348_14525 [Proteobacteria bacterium]|jgi:hypothetical protein|nr:hypothetical protein [Pseudomonadota bacterium]